MKLLDLVAIILLAGSVMEARPVRLWSYQDLEKESDVVLICRVDAPTSRTKNKVRLPNWDGEYDVVVTGFTVEAPLKGDYELSYFQLHHLAYPEDNSIVVNGCGHVWFSEKERFYLVFLSWKDGKLQPTSGDCDSNFSFIELPQQAS